MSKSNKKIVVVVSVEALDEVKKLQSNPFYNVEYGFFNEQKGIKNPIAFFKNAPCFNTLGKKLPEGVGLTDIDAFLCHFPNSLFIEFKKSPEYLYPGQLTALRDLVRTTKGTLFIVFGENCNPTSYVKLDAENFSDCELVPTTLDEFQTILAQWVKDNEPSDWEKFVKECDLSDSVNMILKIQEQYKAQE